MFVDYLNNKGKYKKLVAERDIENYLKKKIKAIGGLSYKFSSPSKRGVPDQIILYRDHVFFVELKSAVGVLSSNQRLRHAEMRKQGFEVYVLRSKEEVDIFLEKNVNILTMGGENGTK